MKKAIGRLSIPLPANIDDIIEIADGDIRAAINNIRFNGKSTDSSSVTKVDSQLSLFPALGRILRSIRRREDRKDNPFEERIPKSLPDKYLRRLLTYPYPEDQCVLRY